MKKLLFCLAVVLILAIAGLAIFIATFDADRYRPLLVSRLESALGRSVRLERLSLGWRGGVALELRQLAIYPGPQPQGEPAVHVENASAVVKLLPLLKKDVQVASVILNRPRVHVARDAGGSVSLTGLGAVATPAAASGRIAAVGPASVAFNIASMRIEDGTLHWTDAMKDPPTELWARAIDVTLKNLSVTTPIAFEASLALLSERPNVKLSGHVQAPSKDRAGLLEGFRLETDLALLNSEELASACPACRALGLQTLSGDLVVAIDRLTLDPKALAQLEAKIRLVGGRLVLARLGSPIEEFTVDALAKQGRLEFTRMSAQLAGGSISLNGVADHLDTRPQATVQATVEQLALEALAPKPGPNEPYLRGRVSASFQGTAQGLTWPQISQTLSGSGTLQLTDAAVVNLNVVQEVFRRLSILPGLVEILEARLPDSHKAKLTARDTILQPVTLAVIAQQGALSFNDLRIATDTFELDGSGSVGLDRRLAIPSRLWIEPDLSAAIIRSVNELAALTDAQGRLELPVQIGGHLSRVVVLPDIQDVAARLIVPKARDLLDDLLKKAFEKDGP